MKLKRVRIVCATPMSRDDFWEKARLSFFLNKGPQLKNIEASIYYDNKEGLAKVYNTHLKKKIIKNEIQLFVHDDVDIQDLFLVEKLNVALEQYDIIGLAGNTVATIKQPCLWHLMSPDRGSWSGAVGHRTSDGTIFMSSFGDTPKRVLLLDGLFLAVDTEKIKKAKVQFDEQFKFHFYDLDFCLSANKNKLKMGTWPIWVIHDGLGDSCKTLEWKESEKTFIRKWTNDV